MIYCISDIHGYPFPQVRLLLRQAGFCKTDFLYVLGDVIDRGPDGVRLLRWMLRQENVKLILGNHEEMLLQCAFLFEGAGDASTDTPERTAALEAWKQNGAQPTIAGMKALPADERDRVLAYLRAAPLYDSVRAGGRDFLLTHSGLRHFYRWRRMADYSADDLLWNRPDADTRYFEDLTVVFGHTPTLRYGEAYAGRILKTPTWINIDAGIGFGYAPALLRLDDLRAFYLE